MMVHFIILLTVAYQFVDVRSSYPLNTTECSAPKSLGGVGTCGPSYCSTKTTSKPTCAFSRKVYDYPNLVSKQTCRTCTQSTDARLKVYLILF